MIALTVSTVVGATIAYFTDDADMTGVTFSSGNADLQMTQKSMGTWFAEDATAAQLGVNFPQDIYPGYSGSWGNPDGVIYLGNFSDSPIDLVVKASIANLVADKGIEDIAELAMAWGGDCDNAGNGTGFHKLSWWETNSPTLFSYIAGSADPATCGLLPNDHSGGFGGYAKSVKFYLRIPASAGNEIADANVSFDIHFDAEQAH